MHNPHLSMKKPSDKQDLDWPHSFWNISSMKDKERLWKEAKRYAQIMNWILDCQKTKFYKAILCKEVGRWQSTKCSQNKGLRSECKSVASLCAPFRLGDIFFLARWGWKKLSAELHSRGKFFLHRRLALVLSTISSLQTLSE